MTADESVMDPGALREIAKQAASYIETRRLDEMRRWLDRRNHVYRLAARLEAGKRISEADASVLFSPTAGL